jgi:hypothetical protein
MAVKISELANLSNPTANTIVFALDNQTNPNTSYQLKLSTLRTFTTASSFPKANAAYNQANAAYNQANTTYEYASDVVYVHAYLAYNQANTANDIATSVQIFANNIDNKSTSGFGQANSAFNHANSCYDFANTSSSVLSAVGVSTSLSFDKANTAHNFANIAYVHANSAYELSNSNSLLSSSANTNAFVALGLSTLAESNAATALVIAESAYIRANTGVDLSTNNSFIAASAYNKANTVEAEFAGYVSNLYTVDLKYQGVSGDGLTDDTSSIQGVIDNNQSKTIIVPPGNYLCNMLYLKPGTTIVGVGSNSVFSSIANNVNIFNYIGDTENGTEFSLKNITISDNNKSNCNGIFISGNTQNQNMCSKVSVNNVDFSGAFVNGVYLNYCEDSIVENNRFSNCNVDVYLRSARKNRIINNNLLSNSNSIIEVSNSNFNMVYGNITKISPNISGANTYIANNLVDESI